MQETIGADGRLRSIRIDDEEAGHETGRVYELHAIDRDHGIRRREIAARQRGLDKPGHRCFAGLRLVDHVKSVVRRDLHSTAAATTTTRGTTAATTAAGTTARGKSGPDHERAREYERT